MRSDARSRIAFSVLGLLTAAALTGAGLAPASSTYAAWSDYSVIPGNVVGAGVWAPDPPAECGPVSDYAGVIYGTPGDDTLTGGNQRQILMGYGGNDTLTAGNSGDCLVGGDGNDTLTGSNAKDIVLGGGGDDRLDGGNGQDVLDGGPGADTCLGGHAPDQVSACEVTP